MSPSRILDVIKVILEKLPDLQELLRSLAGEIPDQQFVAHSDRIKAEYTKFLVGEFAGVIGAFEFLNVCRLNIGQRYVLPSTSLSTQGMGLPPMAKKAATSPLLSLARPSSFVLTSTSCMLRPSRSLIILPVI